MLSGGTNVRDRKHQNARERDQRRRKQNIWPALPLRRMRMVDQGASRQIAEDDQRNGQQRKQKQKALIQIQHVGKILTLESGKNLIGQHSAERPEQIAKEHFRKMNIVAFDP